MGVGLSLGIGSSIGFISGTGSMIAVFGLTSGIGIYLTGLYLTGSTDLGLKSGLLSEI
jgi:hypothetical protein